MALYVKATIVGLVCAILAIVLSVAVPLLFSLGPQLLPISGEGSGGIGAVSIGISEWSVLLPGAIGFVLGVGWTLRRSRRFNNA